MASSFLKLRCETNEIEMVKISTGQKSEKGINPKPNGAQGQQCKPGLLWANQNPPPAFPSGSHHTVTLFMN